MKNIFILLGKSGCGKSTLANEIIKRMDLSSAIMSTTRPRRINEVDGIDYNFLSREVFEDKIENCKFIQYTTFRDWYYGIDEDSLNNCTSDNIIIILSPKAFLSFVHNAKAKDFNIIPIYVHCNNKSRLLRSLERDTDVDEIVRRYEADKNDFDRIVEYILEIGGEVVNNSFDSFEYAVNSLEAIIKEYSKRLCK